MPERPAAWYDKHYEECVPSAQRESLLFKQVIHELERCKAKTILDIGCGEGMLMKLCQDRGFICFGFDFSPVAIGLCKNYHGLKNVWVGDVRDKANYDGDYDAYVTVEVLEHVTEDLAIIDYLKPGTPFIFSVPTWNSPEGSHVRCFPAINKVEERYGEILDIKSINKLKHRWIAVSEVREKEGTRNG